MFRSRVLFLGGYAVSFAVWACSSANSSAFNNEPDGVSSSSGGSSGGSSGSSSGSIGNGFEGGIETNGESGAPGADVQVSVSTTMWADTESELWSVDPTTNTATLVGPFEFPGVADASGSQYTVTDIAVNAAGDIYINTETEVFQAVLPPGAAEGGTGTVTLTNGVPISASAGANGAYFYALAFTPPGALGPSSPEYLIGGDGSGNLWSIDPSTGNSVNLGNFGSDPTNSANYMALSGDIVFYQGTDADGATTYQGLATIRSCTPNANPSYSPTCVKTNDYLAAVDMGALATAFSTGTAAGTLNAGIYGGSATTLGPGIGHGEMFGLAAVGSDIVGFAKYQAPSGGTVVPASTWTINASSATGGAGTQLPQSFSFTDGWAGAAVTTTVTITVGQPPPPPPPK
jgi:hypothetical protein